MTSRTIQMVVRFNRKHLSNKIKLPSKNKCHHLYLFLTLVTTWNLHLVLHISYVRALNVIINHSIQIDIQIFGNLNIHTKLSLSNFYVYNIVTQIYHIPGKGFLWLIEMVNCGTFTLFSKSLRLNCDKQKWRRRYRKKKKHTSLKLIVIFHVPVRALR